MIIFYPMYRIIYFIKILLIVLYMSPTPIGAVSIANSSWYDISFLELTPSGANFYDGSIDSWNTTLANINFARILTGMTLIPPGGYETVHIRFDAPGEVFRFVKMDDPTKFMDATIRLQHQSLPIQSVSPLVDYPIVAGALGTTPTETDLYMDVTSLPPNSGQSWRGTYYFPLQIQIYDIDGNVLAEKTLQMTVFFRNKDIPVPPVTNLLVEQYVAADHIPVPYPYQAGLPVIAVGGIQFQSNEEYNKYRLRISPVDQTKFQFNHTNPNVGGTIMYRVTIPGRTVVSYEESFTFNLDYKGSIGNWYDFLEVGVRDVNYNNSNGPAGSYSSSIRIELISF